MPSLGRGFEERGLYNGPSTEASPTQANPDSHLVLICWEDRGLSLPIKAKAEATSGSSRRPGVRLRDEQLQGPWKALGAAPT